MTNHPDPLQIQLYADGELSWLARFGLRRHLAGCWRCRAELDEVRKAMAHYVRYVDQVLLPGVPPPPRPWKEMAWEVAPASRGARYLRPALAAILGGVALGAMAVVLVQGPSPPAPVPRVEPQPAPAAPPPVAPPAPSAPIERPVTAPPAPDRNTEVRIFAALHEVGADAGDPVEVAVSGSGWRVTSAGLDEDRQARLRTALERLPSVRFEIESARPSVSPRQLPAAGGEPGGTELPPGLEAYFGSRAAADAFIGEVISESERILARAHALRVLAERFPDAVRSGLGEEERAMLAAMRAGHLAEIRKSAAVLSAKLPPVLRLLGPAEAPPESCSLIECAQRLDSRLSALLSARTGPPAGVAAALAGVQAALEVHP